MLRPDSQVPQYLLGGRRVREKQAIAEAIEHDPQQREALGGGSEQAGEPEALGEAVLGREPVALAAGLIGVGEVRAARGGAPGGDIVGEQARGPQAVVSEGGGQRESPLTR